MTAYIIDLSIGGTMRVKVEADTEDLAKEVAERYFIEDWTDAGPLKLGDVRIDGIYDAGDVSVKYLDASIVAKNELDWEFATDDPHDRGVGRDDPAT